ncbi:hypothetical protein ACFQZX_12415 [Mucilaginibacter litoreus]|uniref:Uncharacterized protein n=1 Tax=Mucilaginibacter litoreus TaxID=1048221 RepID=A0ABW3ATP5_9SPHI
MRKLFLFFLFLLTVSIARAQTPNMQWDEGTVYHTSGEVFHGLVSWTPPMKGEYPDGDQIFYRADANSNVFPIPYYKLRAFTMAADSFVVSTNVILKNSPILLVEVDGPFNLYAASIFKQGFPLLIGSGGGGGNFGVGMEVGTHIGRGVKTTYYFGKDPNNVTKIDKKNFAATMSSILAGKPEVVTKIKDRTFRYGDMKALLDYYYTGKLPINTNE